MHTTICNNIEKFKPISHEFLKQYESICDISSELTNDIWQFIDRTIASNDEIMMIEFNKNSNIGLLINKIITFDKQNYIKDVEIIGYYSIFQYVNFMNYEFIVLTESDIDDKISLIIHTSTVIEFLEKLSNKHLNTLY